MNQFQLHSSQTVLLIVDVQDKVFNVVDRGSDVLYTMSQLIEGFKILQLPILLTEQYPEGLGKTIQPIRNLLGNEYHPWTKTTFSSLDDSFFHSHALSLPYNQWVVMGIEAHICVLQTVKSLLSNGKQVIVPNDAITSRSVYDFSTAIAEMRDAGARISCTETILFELMRDARHPKFKQISTLIRKARPCCPCTSGNECHAE